MASELLNLVETYVDICIQEGQGVSIFFALKRKVTLKLVVYMIILVEEIEMK